MNQAKYAEDAQYWAKLLESVVNGSSPADFRPWLNTSYSNYAPGDDSIVIFSLFSAARAKGLSIQQRLDLPLERPWLEMHSRVASGEPGRPIKHLVIDCSRHPTIESFIRETVKFWFLSEIESFFCSTIAEQGHSAAPDHPNESPRTPPRP
jgi:hypothetical protein